MASTDNRMQTYWTEARAFIEQNWPRISATELDSIAGNFDKFLFFLNEHYGNFPLNEAVARDKINRFLLKTEDATFKKTS